MLPGLGHVYWRELSFGLFILLIMLIGMLLFLVSFFFDFGFWVSVLMFSLPVLFYIFTFVDLHKTIRRRIENADFTSRRIWLFLGAGVVIQLFAPVTPVNFYWRNAPSIETIRESNMAPLLNDGDVIKVDQLEYKVSLFFIEKPILYASPHRFETIQYLDDNNYPQFGIVLGTVEETVSITDKRLVINGESILIPDELQTFFNNDFDLTYVSAYSILVADIRLGTINQLREIPLERIKGKVESLF